MTHSPVVIHQVQETENFFFEDLVTRCLHFWYWFLATLTISMGLGYLYIVHKQPVYQIHAKLLIKDQQKGVEEINAIKQIQPISPKKIIEDEIEILHSSVLMKRVVEKLNLAVHYYKPNGLLSWEVFEETPFSVKVIKATPLLYAKPIEISFTAPNIIHIDGVMYPVGTVIKTVFGTLQISSDHLSAIKNQSFNVHFVPVENEVLQLLDDLKVESVNKNSSVVQLSINDVISARGEMILTQLFKEYSQAAILDKSELAANTLHFIDQRIQNLSADVVRVEKNLEDYKTNHKITDLSNEADYALKTMQDNDAKINEITIQLTTLNDLEKYINSQKGKGSTTPAILGLQDKVLISLIERITRLEQERSELEKLTSDQNFLVQNLTDQIKAGRLNVLDNIRTMRTMFLSSEKQLLTRNALLETQIRGIPQKERKLVDITRQQAVKNELYTYMLKKREETAVSLGASFSNSHIINPPQSTINPVKPVKSLVFGFFMLMGLVCPIIVIAGQKILNKRIYQRKDVEEQTSVPILGEIIRYPSSKPLVFTSTDHTIISEQIRGLRATFQLMQSQASKSLVLLTTSSISGEGKTFLSRNVGVSLALANFPTVLVEMDLRNPRLHKDFGIPNKVGISNYIKGECELDEIIHSVPGYDHLYLVPSGLATSSPAELLCSPRLAQLMNLLKQRFAFVIIDTPPIGIISDAQLLAPFADVTLFVVRHDITPKNCLKIIDDLNKEKRFPQPMIILNAVPEAASYRLGYSYKYTQGYSF